MRALEGCSENWIPQVFDIEVDEGLTLKCGYNYGQNPYEVRVHSCPPSLPTAL